MNETNNLIEEWFSKGNNFLNLKNYEKANECYEEGLKLIYTDFTKYMQAAANAMGDRNEQEFNSNLDKANALKLNLDKVWHKKGICFVKLNKIGEAIKCYEQSLKYNSENPKIWFNLGVLYSKTKNLLKEYICYNEALKYNPNYANALYNKGILLLFSGRINESLNYFNKAIENDPKFTNAWSNKGTVLQIFGKYQEAIDCFNEALIIDPKSKYALNNKGGTLLALKKYNEAIEIFEKYLKLYPEDYVVWGHKGIGLLELKKFEEAFKCFNTSLEFNANYARGFEYKGLAYIRCHNYEKAIENLNIAKNIYHEKREIDEVENTEKLLIWARNSKELTLRLKIIDEKFINCLNCKTILELKDQSMEVSGEIKQVKNQFKNRELPEDIKDLLRSKYICFNTLAKILEFDEINLDMLSKAKKIFSDWKVNNLLIAINSLENFYYAIKKYSSLEDIPPEKEYGLLLQLKSISFLNGDLSDEVYGLYPANYFIQDAIFEKYPEKYREFLIKESYRKKVKIDFVAKPPKVYTGFTESGYELNQQLIKLGFWNEYEKLSDNASLWFDIIGALIFLLDMCYNHSKFLRNEAQKWELEPRDMSPWVSFYLSLLFGENLKDRTGVSDGNADHWIGNIPIEDKLIRASKKQNIDELIIEFFNKHKTQIFREAGKSGFGIFVAVDIRDEIKNNTIPASPIKKTFKIFYENNCWISIFIFQAFTDTPSNA